MYIDDDLVERAKHIMNSRPTYVIEEPIYERLNIDPFMTILLLPFLPFILIAQAIIKPRRRLLITEIEKTQTGYRILEYEI
ncbi:MAG: hypothetical protein QXN17_03740 [Nitrososphaerota archaeon]